MKQVSKASQLNKSVKQVSLASQVKQVGLASQVSNLPKSSQESEIKKVLVKQVQVKQVKSSKFKLSNLNQASEVMLDRDTAPRKRPSTRLSGKNQGEYLGAFTTIMVKMYYVHFPWLFIFKLHTVHVQYIKGNYISCAFRR